MNISLENIDKVSGVLTVKIEKADYQEQVDASLKALRRRAQLPGFRKGMVPIGMIRKMYHKSTVVEEINKLVPGELSRYIQEHEIRVIGEPMPNKERQAELDFDAMDTFEFIFDIAIAPEFEVKVSNKDKIDYYTVDVTAKVVDEHIKTYTQRHGCHEQVESYRENDMLKGLIAELDEQGNTKEGGIRVENAVLMPTYMKDDTQKAIFEDAKLNDVLVFNPNKAFGGNETEIAYQLHVEKTVVAGLVSDFSFQIAEITRFVEAELDQKLFDQVFGESAVSNEEEFRAKVKAIAAEPFVVDSDEKFLFDARELLVKKVGELEFPEAMLKRFMALHNPDASAEAIEENYIKSLKELQWHLIKGKLIKEYGIDVQESDIVDMAKELTKMQFVKYGMLSTPDEILESYSAEMLKKKENVDMIVNRVLNAKLVTQLKEKMKVNSKTVSIEEFKKLIDE